MSTRTLQYVIFTLIAVVIALVCFVLANRQPPPEPLISLLMNIAAVFFGVGLVSLVWRLLGRRASEKTTCELADQVTEACTLTDRMKDACRLAEQARELGILWIWPSRLASTGDRREVYRRLLERPQKVDLMGLNLCHEVFAVDDMRDLLVEAISRLNTEIRILISDPNVEQSLITQQRASEPGERKAAVLTHLLGKAEEGLKDICGRLTEAKRRRFIDGIRLAHESVIYCMIIRIDEQMFLCNYLSSIVGNETPGMQIRKQGSAGLFAKYAREFKEAWKNGRPLDKAERARISP